MKDIHPWLATLDWTSYGDLLRTKVQWPGVVHNRTRQLAYVLVFGTAAWARFTTKDVLACAQDADPVLKPS